MSTFKIVQANQDVATVLFENQGGSNQLNMNIETVTITNVDSNSVQVDLHVHEANGNGGINHSVLKADIPAGVTLVYDTPFSFAHNQKLRIKPENRTCDLNIIIN